MAALAFDAVSRRYPGGAVALDRLELSVADGELLVLLGPSGCGKSTALRLVAGLDSPTEGRILLDGRDVTALSPGARDVAMVFQGYALYPHRTVRGNLEFPLRMRRVPRAERAARVARVAAALELTALLDRRPAQLSGGQRQRVALGRALVREPAVFLLDEPLSNLDAALRQATRVELLRLHRSLGATMLHVTHDQEEALTLGQRVAVLRAGRLEQVDAPLRLYRRPANVFVAGFLGSPPMNLLDVVLQDGHLQRPGLRLPLSPTWSPGTGRELVLGVRPPEVALARPGEAEADAVLDVAEPHGPDTVLHLRLADGTMLRARRPAGEPLPAPGEAVGVRLPAASLHLFERGSGRRLAERGPD